MRARLIASIVYWIQLLLYSGVVLYAPALALEATTGMSKTGSILIIGLVCAFYSSIGGIKAVLITDVFQAFLMFVSLFVVIGTAAHNAGGFSEIWRIADAGHRLEFDKYATGHQKIDMSEFINAGAHFPASRSIQLYGTLGGV